jgi:glycopeptide antibiotics resistance protein
MNNSSSDLFIRKRENIMFFLSLFVVSLSAVMLIIFLFINSPDTITLKRPVILLLFPIYLIVRFIFLKVESNKNIKINKVEETVKLLLFIYFLAFMLVKIFPLNKGFDPRFLAISLFSFNTLFSIDFIIKNWITYLILFIPLGFLVPIIMTRFRNISNCLILGFLISVMISVLEILLHFSGLYLVDIISLDSLFINLLGTFIGYKLFYYWNRNYNK